MRLRCKGCIWNSSCTWKEEDIEDEFTCTDYFPLNDEEVDEWFEREYNRDIIMRMKEDIDYD